LSKQGGEKIMMFGAMNDSVICSLDGIVWVPIADIPHSIGRDHIPREDAEAMAAEIAVALQAQYGEEDGD
jgi:hypothetical protein